MSFVPSHIQGVADLLKLRPDMLSKLDPVLHEGLYAMKDPKISSMLDKSRGVSKMGMGGMLSKYLGAMGPKGEELLALLAKGGEKAGEMGGHVVGMGKAHPEVTAALGGAAAGYGGRMAQEGMSGEEEGDDNDDVEDLDEDSILRKYLKR